MILRYSLTHEEAAVLREAIAHGGYVPEARVEVVRSLMGAGAATGCHGQGRLLVAPTAHGLRLLANPGMIFG